MPTRLLASFLFVAAVMAQRAAAAPALPATLSVSAVVVRPVLVYLVPARGSGAPDAPGRAPLVFVDGAPPGAVLEVRATDLRRAGHRAPPVVPAARVEAPRLGAGAQVREVARSGAGWDADPRVTSDSAGPPRPHVEPPAVRGRERRPTDCSGLPWTSPRPFAHEERPQTTVGAP